MVLGGDVIGVKYSVPNLLKMILLYPLELSFLGIERQGENRRDGLIIGH